MSSPPPDVVIIGAGVTGLTTGVCLAEHGLRVLIRTAHRPLETTSAAAGALWDFGYASHAQVSRWGRRTHKEWRDLTGGSAGVEFVDGMGAARGPWTIPDLILDSPSFRMCRAEELPAGFSTGWRCRLPIVDMPVYLGYLESRFLARGGAIELGAVAGFREVFAETEVVINCAGMGAAGLVENETEIEPVRGELVVVENPGITEFFAEYTDDLVDMVYLLPQGGRLVLGGTADRGVNSRRHEDEAAARIIDRCARVCPEVRHAKVLEYRVGVRPERAKVRVELERLEGRRLVHNYGHGGSGVTLSWGCAEDVLELLRESS